MVGVDQRAVLVDVPELAARHRRVGVRDHGCRRARASAVDRGPAGLAALALQGVEVRHGVLPDLDLEVAVRRLDGEEVADVDVRRAQLGREPARRTSGSRSRRGAARPRPPAGRRSARSTGRGEPALDLGHRRRVAVPLGEEPVAGSSPSPTRIWARRGSGVRGDARAPRCGRAGECRRPVAGVAGRPRAGPAPARGCRAVLPIRIDSPTIRSSTKAPKRVEQRGVVAAGQHRDAVLAGVQRGVRVLGQLGRGVHVLEAVHVGVAGRVEGADHQLGHVGHGGGPATCGATGFVRRVGLGSNTCSG